MVAMVAMVRYGCQSRVVKAGFAKPGCESRLVKAGLCPSWLVKIAKVPKPPPPPHLQRKHTSII